MEISADSEIETKIVYKINLFYFSKLLMISVIKQQARGQEDYVIESFLNIKT